MKRVISLIVIMLLFMHTVAFADPIRWNYSEEEIQEMIADCREELPSWCEAGFHDGRILIPAVNIDVGYRFEYTMWDWQWITDLLDTACLFHWYEGHDILADHKNQNFENLININIGDILYFVKSDTIETYRCVDVFDGHNTEWTLTDADYNSITQDYELFCYTCLDWWANIRICVFEKGE